MKLSYNWLKDYLGFGDEVTPEKLAEILTHRACPVEGIETVAGGDRCLVLEVTFNRADLLSHLGVARELSGAVSREPRLPEPKLKESALPVEKCASVTVETPDLCPRYTARVIRGVRVGESPAWLKARLEAVGVRPVNNVVDATNFVLFDVGQPLHAFDLALLDGPKIIVRRGRAGEKIAAIDGSEHAIDERSLVIADARRPVAIAGVMGGRDTEITERTRDVLIESAYFDPVTIRRAVRRTGLRSDSSYRFERGVDPSRVEWASRLAAVLIQEIAGGELCAGVIDIDAKTLPGPKSVPLRMERLRRLSGVEVAPERARSLLESLGMAVTTRDSGSFDVLVPTARFEVAREVDLIEEVLRTHGYDKVEVKRSLPLPVQRGAAGGPVDRPALLRARSLLIGAGYREIQTVSFVEAEDVIDPPLFHLGSGSALRVKNPVRPEAPALRRSLYGSLLRTKKTNLDRGNRRVKLFEVGNAYWLRHDAQPDERAMLGLLSDATFLDVKGELEALMSTLGIRTTSALPGDEPAPTMKLHESSSPAFDPLEQAEIRLASTGGEMPLGFIGKVSREAAERFDLGRDRPVLAIIDWTSLSGASPKTRKIRELPSFPAVTRDLACVVDSTTLWADLDAEARRAESPILREVRFLSVFEGDGKSIPAGKKSIALRMEFRAADRTLTGAEADEAREAVKTRLRGRFQDAIAFRE